MNIKLKHIPYPNLVRIKIIADGSCFFHSILRAFDVKYIRASVSQRKKIVKKVRTHLANSLFSQREDGKILYDELSNGSLREFSKEWKPASLSNMYNELRSNKPVGNIYQELVSEIFSIDIYLINLKTGDIYPTSSDNGLLYKGRMSIIILIVPGHYDLLSMNNKTVFPPDYPLIVFLRNRLDLISKR